MLHLTAIHAVQCLYRTNVATTDLHCPQYIDSRNGKPENDRGHPCGSRNSQCNSRIEQGYERRDRYRTDCLATTVLHFVEYFLGIFYISGAGIALLFFSLSTWRMWRLIHRYPGCSHKKYRLIVCPEKISSFSWGNTIVLSQEDYNQYADAILLHEEIHLQYRHTLDLIGMEILIIFHWFNPAVWLLMRELREIHEYEADYGVLAHGIDATQYQLLLVRKSVGTRLYSMASGLTHSKLKNRINMMLRRRTNNWARLKLLLFVPVAAATLMAFALPEVKKRWNK